MTDAPETPPAAVECRHKWRYVEHRGRELAYCTRCKTWEDID